MSLSPQTKCAYRNELKLGGGEELAGQEGMLVYLLISKTPDNFPITFKA